MLLQLAIKKRDLFPNVWGGSEFWWFGEEYTVRQRWEMEEVSYKVGWDWQLIGGAKTWKAEKFRVMGRTMYDNWLKKRNKRDEKKVPCAELNYWTKGTWPNSISCLNLEGGWGKVPQSF